MATLGERLREERERREIPLDQVARETKISVRFLAALESGEFENLPGSAFNRGFVQAYARCLGLDPEPLVKAYAEEEDTLTREGRLPARPDVLDEMRESIALRDAGGHEALRRALRFAVPVVAGIAVIALAGWLILPRIGGRLATRAEPAGSAETNRGASAAGDAQAPVRSTPLAPERSDRSFGDDLAETREQAPAGGDSASNPATERMSDPAPIVGEPEPTLPSAVVEPAAPRRATAEADDAAPRPVPAAVGSGISIPEARVGIGVTNRQIVGESDRFVEGTPVFFWTRVVGAEPGSQIRHVWIRDGREIAATSLPIGGAHWRTYSRRTLRRGDAGPWTVEARDESGRVLATLEFRCEPRPDA